MAIWFTADTHFGHTKIISLCHRPFRDANDMNSGLIERWNSRVSSLDLVYVLGDFSFMGVKMTEDIIKSLNGDKVLIRGNHDWARSRAKWIRMGFADCLDSWSTPISGHEVLLEHLPYSGDWTPEDRFSDKRPLNRGGWLLHGHVHSGWKERDKMLNVGVDVWDCYPVAMSTVESIIRRDTHVGDAGK